MMRLLLGGSKESFKTLTTQDALNIRDSYFGNAAAGIFYRRRINR